MSSIRKKSILVVDDDAGMRRAIRKVLGDEGAIVTCAEWAGEAFEIMSERKNRFDLIITDQRMPVITGTSLVFAVRKIFPELPVIVFTAFGGSDLRTTCAELGAAAFLEKPLNAERLLTEVQATLATSTVDSEKSKNRESDQPDEKGRNPPPMNGKALPSPPIRLSHPLELSCNTAAPNGLAGLEIQEDIAVTRIFTIRVRQEMARLSSEHREVLLLRSIKNFSYRDISIRLGISIDIVKKRIARARGELCSHLAEDF